MAGKKSLWIRRKRARPKELVDAALDLFVEQGYAATRLVDVARRAGVSKPTVYVYFKNKEELFKSVVWSSIVPDIAEAEYLLAGSQQHSADLLRNAVMLWWTHIGAKKGAGIIKIIAAEVSNFPDLAQFYQTEVIERDLRLISGILERGMARNEFRHTDVASASQVLIAQMLMLSVWMNSPQFVKPSILEPISFLESMIDLALRGLMPAPVSVSRGLHAS